MPLELHSKFDEYLNTLMDKGQITKKTLRNYRQYVRWISLHGDGKLTIQSLQDDAYVLRLIAAVEIGFNENPGPNRMYDWNAGRTKDAKSVLNHYREFLNQEPFNSQTLVSVRPRQAWIFQSTPDDFDILGYVSKYDRIYWSVGHVSIGKRVMVGDEVFIWKAYGKKRDFAGVIAHGVVVEPATDKVHVRMPEKLGDEFWKGKGEEKSKIKVGIQLGTKTVIPEHALLREALATDKVLRNSQIIKTNVGTVLELTAEQTQRLHALWKASPIRTVANVQEGLEENGEFDPKNKHDGKEKVLRSIALRRGQPKFRKDLLIAYENCCAVTGVSIQDILEAAHILPYDGPSTNHVCNGLLLRSDIHSLFDLGLLSVEPEAFVIYCSETIRHEALYSKLHGTALRLPKNAQDKPNGEALRIHFEKRVC